MHYLGKKDNNKQNPPKPSYLSFICIIMFEICLSKLRQLIREQPNGNKSVLLLQSSCRSLGVIFTEFWSDLAILLGHRLGKHLAAELNNKYLLFCSFELFLRLSENLFLSSISVQVEKNLNIKYQFCRNLTISSTYSMCNQNEKQSFSSASRALRPRPLVLIFCFVLVVDGVMKLNMYLFKMQQGFRLHFVQL